MVPAAPQSTGPVPAEPDEVPVCRILGPLEVERHGRRAPVTSRRQQKVLAVLLVNAGMSVGVDRLVDALWDEPPPSARQQVHNVVGGLRRSLAAVERLEIVTSPGGYRLVVPEHWVDSAQFEDGVRRAGQLASADRLDEAVSSLSRALSLWRGPALAGLTERHLAAVAARLEEQRLAAVELLMQLRLRRGETASLTGELIELVAEHPLRQSLRSSLMLALSRSGRPADGLAVFEEGRRLLADELGLDPSPAMWSLQQHILAGDESGGAEDLRQPAPVTGRGGDGVAGPCYLPHDIAEFAGRADEVDQLLAATRLSTPTALVICAIDGMGGVGKTTVAVHLAHQVADQYPDGQLFIDLHGYTAGVEPVTPSQALDTLLHNIGTPPEAIPADLAGRSALWRARMAGRKALVVLDNALNEAHVRPLLPGTAGSLIVITSRRKLTALEGAVPLSLDVLTQADALALFTRIDGGDRPAAEPEATEAAVELCGRLPVALRIAAARLRDRRSWTVAHLVRRLRGSRHPSRMLSAGDRSVFTVLVLSYKYLSPEHARLFRLLSLHPGGDFDAYAAAALTGLSTEATDTALEGLHEDSLLLQRSPGRYAFHDLVRDCAIELCEEHDDEVARARARRRLLTFYLHSVRSWCDRLAVGQFARLPAPADKPLAINPAADDEESVALLKTDYRNVVQAIRCAREHALPALCWQLTCSLQPYLRLINYGPEAVALFEDAVAAARAIGDDAGESACLTGQALATRARGDNSAARHLLEDALRISRRLGDRFAEVYQLADLGGIHLVEYRYGDAHARFVEAHRIATDIRDRQALADLSNNLGVVCRELGQFGQALEHFTETLELDQGTSSRSSHAITVSNIGLLLHLQRRYADARTSFVEALSLSHAVSSQYGESFALIGLCMTDRALGRAGSAVTHGRRALELTRNAGLYDVEWDALNFLGDAQVSLGDLAAAERTFSEAETSAGRHRSSRYIARAHEGLAHVALASGDLEAARVEWEGALSLLPPGVFDARDVRGHLEGLGSVRQICRRCDVAVDRSVDQAVVGTSIHAGQLR